MIPLELDYDAVARPERIRTLFQPLVSIKNRRIIAVEALSRGYLPEMGVTLPPGLLFSLAPDTPRALELDRLCREAAMLRFHPLHVKRRDLLLTVNLDMSLVNRDTLGSGRFAKAARDAGLAPENVVIEIIESRVDDMDVLEDFIARHRDQGFLIALDDIGAGHSNLDRIPGIKPDVIKIDRGLISGIHEEYHKFEIVRALTRLGRNIGAMIVAEGVEREEEVLRLLELGVDIFQGFYFARPEPAEGRVPPVPENVAEVAKRFHKLTIESINRRGTMHAAYDRALNTVAGTLAQAMPPQFDTHLARALSSHPDIECLYVLNPSGRQVSSTMCNPDVIPEHRRFLYQPAPKGTDHSLKEYYLPIRAGLPRFTTEPYISMASGNQCITISAPFKDAKNHGFILCMDIGLHDQLAFGPAPAGAKPRMLSPLDTACLCTSTGN
jgi:EAL domain-containing protein (putative c-di-GMP-specific phosphodiesterase class I)